MHAQVFGCRKKMSAIAILNPQGAEVLYKRMHDLAAQGRQEFAQMHGEVIHTSCLSLHDFVEQPLSWSAQQPPSALRALYKRVHDLAAQGRQEVAQMHSEVCPHACHISRPAAGLRAKVLSALMCCWIQPLPVGGDVSRTAFQHSASTAQGAEQAVLPEMP